jgi:hypothetical protein
MEIGYKVYIASFYHIFKNGSFRYRCKEDKGKIIIGSGSLVGGMCSILARGGGGDLYAE